MSDEPKVVDLDSRRTYYGNNYEQAAVVLDELQAELAESLRELKAGITSRNRSESLEVLGFLEEQLSEIRMLIVGPVPEDESDA